MKAVSLIQLLSLLFFSVALHSCLPVGNDGQVSLLPPSEGNSGPNTLPTGKIIDKEGEQVDGEHSFIPVVWSNLNMAFYEEGRLVLIEDKEEDEFIGLVESEQALNKKQVVFTASSSEDHYYVGVKNESQEYSLKLEAGALRAFYNSDRMVLDQPVSIGDKLSFYLDSSGYVVAEKNGTLLHRFSVAAQSDMRPFARFWGAANQKIDLSGVYLSAGPTQEGVLPPNDLLGAIDPKTDSIDTEPPTGPLVDAPIESALISDSQSNRLSVSFSESIEVSNAQGFRLVGGAARIDELLSGSGSNTLVFSLTDFVLPDDTFTLLYWQELGDAQTSSGRLKTFEAYPVANQANRYNGSGTLYYVSTSGSDGNAGTSVQAPFRKIQTGLNKAHAGDYVLLKRGDSWVETPRFVRSGTPSRYIVLAAYATGSKPIVRSTGRAATFEFTRSYNQVDNIHVIQPGGGAAINYKGANSCIASNNFVRPASSTTIGINPSGRHSGTKNPIVINNNVSGFWANIRSSGYPLETVDGTPSGELKHQVHGGLIENNDSHKTRRDGRDCFAFQRGNYHSLIVRKNRFSQWDDDGMDLIHARNIIVEYNTAYSDKTETRSNSVFKAGGITRAPDNVLGVRSRNITIRYNIVHDVEVSNGVATGSGDSGKIYGNLFYNIKGNGIKIQNEVKDWNIFNNTIINASENGVQTWAPSNQSGVVIQNNLIDSGGDNIKCMRISCQGANNIFVQNTTSGLYSGSGDFQESLDNLLVDSVSGDYRLKQDSPAVGRGIAIEQYTRDLFGNIIDTNPDIGAHELYFVR